MTVSPDDDDILADFQACITRALADMQVMPASDVPRVATGLCTSLRRQFGGRAIYLRTGGGADRQDRDEQIRLAVARGRSRDDVQREFGISRAQFYRIVKPPSLTD